MNTRPRRDTQRIAEEAAEWIEALEDDDAETRTRFAAWLKASPRHVEELLVMRALDAEGRRVDSDRRFNVQDILAAADSNVVSLAPPQPPSPKHTSRLFVLRWVAGVAALTIASAALWLSMGTQQWETYATAISEQRSVELEDGSLIQVNTHSRLEVRLTDSRREVRLVEGEALFKVAHDSKRPFQVISGETIIQAIGTQFNVYRRASGTTISVIEGLVSVSEPAAKTLLIPAGEEARTVPNGTIIRATVEPEVVTAWQQRRLMFRDKTLFEIAEEFNRYNRSPRIVVEGDSLKSRTYGGTFNANDPRSLVDFVRPEPGITIEERPQEWVIRGR